METRIFTFGSNQYDPYTGKHLLGFYATVTAPTAGTCEQIMQHLYGGMWATDYPTVEAAGVGEWGLIEHVRIVLGATSAPDCKLCGHDVDGGTNTLAQHQIAEHGEAECPSAWHVNQGNKRSRCPICNQAD